jgi:Jhy protein
MTPSSTNAFHIADLNNDALIVKRANAERIKEFSRKLKDYNRSALETQRRLPNASEALSIEVTKKRLESNRERALNFAKNVPKPKVKTSSGSGGDEEQTGARGGVGCGENYGDDDEDHLLAPDEFGTSFEEAARLQELQAKHQESRRKIEAIKRSMGI